MRKVKAFFMFDSRGRRFAIDETEADRITMEFINLTMKKKVRDNEAQSHNHDRPWR